jgi:hypothetical protein
MGMTSIIITVEGGPRSGRLGRAKLNMERSAARQWLGE